MSTSAKQCLLRFGVFTDNHFAPEIPQTKVRTLAAMQLFRKHNVEAVLDCGDITDRYLPEELEKFRRMYEEVWSDPAERPVRVWIPAGHDIQGNPLGKDAYPEVIAHLGLETAEPCITIKGYSFIGVPQGGDFAKWEKRIAEAVSRAEGKPVFALTHDYARNTLLYSEFAGLPELREQLKKYPQVILFCGHSHHPIRHGRSIWQGEFTAINAGSPYYWKDRTHGRGSRRHESGDALICELYADELLIRRFELWRPELEELEPWRVPLPFDPETAPYRPERRSQDMPVPEFPAESALAFSAPELPLVRGRLSIPYAEPRGVVEKYRVTLWEKKRELAVLDYYPETWPGMQHDGCEDFLLPPAMLRSNTEYRCRVVPVNQYGKAGKALELSFTAPESAWKPLPSGKILLTVAGAPFPLAPDGSFTLTPEQAASGWNKGFHVEIPQEIAARRKNTVAVLELESRPNSGDGVLMACGIKPDYKRHFLGPEAEVCHRHVFELSALEGEDIFVALYGGNGGSFRLRSVQFFCREK